MSYEKEVKSFLLKYGIAGGLTINVGYEISKIIFPDNSSTTNEMTSDFADRINEMWATVTQHNIDGLGILGLQLAGIYFALRKARSYSEKSKPKMVHWTGHGMMIENRRDYEQRRGEERRSNVIPFPSENRKEERRNVYDRRRPSLERKVAQAV